jgi:hypothetical protein
LYQSIVKTSKIHIEIKPLIYRFRYQSDIQLMARGAKPHGAHACVAQRNKKGGQLASEPAALLASDALPSLSGAENMPCSICMDI